MITPSQQPLIYIFSSKRKRFGAGNIYMNPAKLMTAAPARKIKSNPNKFEGFN